MPLNAPEAKWTEVERYIAGRLVGQDAALEAAAAANSAAGLPPIEVAPNAGKFLYLLARLVGARRILEVGTLGGYSTIWMARALPKDGRLISLELEEKHAKLARANLDRAGVGERVEIRVGKALDSLETMAAEKPEPFDFFFIDADKRNNPNYLQWAKRLARVGSLIVVDNVVRDGAVVEAGSSDPDIHGTRRLFEMLAAEPGLTATALQTVGSKGYDGFALALVEKAG
jgi:predicted O-methyltransferase YrrM